MREKCPPETYDPIMASMHLGVVSEGHCSRVRKLDMELLQSNFGNSGAYIGQVSLALGLAGITRASLASGGAGDGDGGHSKGDDSMETHLDGGCSKIGGSSENYD